MENQILALEMGFLNILARLRAKRELSRVFHQGKTATSSQGVCYRCRIKAAFDVRTRPGR
uniref:Uncharacterized protein n=1 Tax=Candidatus Kentrum sp. FW TaxID=2126338 RepID=A0A450U2Q4_9GAMM|nr:MAG: hypothetical protein BECKFW1821C_GA0114237_11227 [Candidatus Kentron sp. FW]